MARAVRILVVTTALTLAGCSGVQKTVGGWFDDVAGGGTPQTGSVYFAASDGLVMHSEASGSSPVVARLALHEKVVRTRLDRGWAYVTADGSGTSGWVDNAQLIWRLPAATQPGTATAAQPAAPSAPPATDTTPAPDAAPVPAAAAPVSADAPAAAPPPDVAPAAATNAAPSVEPAAAPAPKAPSPEIFDPF